MYLILLLGLFVWYVNYHVNSIDCKMHQILNRQTEIERDIERAGYDDRERESYPSHVQLIILFSAVNIYYREVEERERQREEMEEEGGQLSGEIFLSS